MLIAREKRRNNIAEYVIYMWHVEDLVRACKFDLDAIKSRIVEPFKADDATSKEIEGWYESIIQMMREQNILEKGHLSMVTNTITEMHETHIKLLNHKDEHEYRKLFHLAQHNILIFRGKSGLTNENDIEVCINAMYSLLLLRMTGKNITIETIESMGTFSKLLAALSFKFKEWEEGRLDLV